MIKVKLLSSRISASLFYRHFHCQHIVGIARADVPVKLPGGTVRRIDRPEHFFRAPLLRVCFLQLRLIADPM